MENNHWSTSNCGLMSNDVRLLLQSLLKAEAKFKVVEKSGKAGTGNRSWTYSKLIDIYNACVEALREENIKVHHWKMRAGDQEIICTRITHSLSGQYIGDERFSDPQEPGAQAKGKEETYAKRYALLSLLGLAPEEDDDGQSEQHYIQNKKSTVTFPKTINAQQVRDIEALFETFENSAEVKKQLLEWQQVKELRFVKEADLPAVLKWLKE